MKKLNVMVFLLVFSFLSISTVFAESPKAQLSAAGKSANAPQLFPKEISSDNNRDGKPDRWERYENGVLVGVDADANQDGVIDEKGYVENGKLVKVEKDSDFDGKMDKWIKY